jgi:hypothetical protein
MIASAAKFDKSKITDIENINYDTCPVLGDAPILLRD